MDNSSRDSFCHQPSFGQGYSDWSGTDTLYLNITDLGNVGTGVALSTAGQVNIVVSPINDPPDIVVDPHGFGLLPGGGALGTDEDVPLSLALLAIQDKEISAGGRGRLTVSLQCSNGGFTVPLGGSVEDDEAPAMAVVWTVGGLAEGAGMGPWQAIAFSGGLTETNHLLGELEYLPGPNWHGVDDLNVSLRTLAEFI